MRGITLGVRGIDAAPELTNDALEWARWNPEVGCLVDAARPGRPLILGFGFVDWKELPIFDFFGRTKKLEAAAGTPLNRILVRDPGNAWYHRGVPGLGAHVDEVVGSLRGLIRSIRPSSVATVGQSMGGYAALLFGTLLGADRIVAFGPLSHLDPAEAARSGDLRFLRVMQELAADPPRSYYPDLAMLADRLDYRGTTHLVFGTHPGRDDGASGNLDALHALRLARRPGVVLHPHPGADHLIIPWLIEHRRLDPLLAALLLDRGPPDP